jgi:hypothetical protein
MFFWNILTAESAEDTEEEKRGINKKSRDAISHLYKKSK